MMTCLSTTTIPESFKVLLSCAIRASVIQPSLELPNSNMKDKDLN